MVENERILDRLMKRKNKFVKLFVDNGTNKENLKDKQQNLSIQFIEGLADGIGIPTKNLEVDKIQEWILSFVRSFYKPEYLDQSVEPSDIQLRKFGKKLGIYIKNGILITEVMDETEVIENKLEDFEENDKIKGSKISIARY